MLGNIAWLQAVNASIEDGTEAETELTEWRRQQQTTTSTSQVLTVQHFIVVEFQVYFQSRLLFVCLFFI